MAIIQFSVPADVYVTLVERGRALGISEHQVAKYAMLLAYDNAADEDILERMRNTKREQMRNKTRARPLS